MPEITIENFSCIRSAAFELRRLNIIIGPQGSGKSVTTKLIYFFADLVQDAMRHAEDGLSFTDYKRHLQKSFAVWFPPSAWGAERFNIKYMDGLMAVRVMRRMAGGNPTEEVTITLSRPFEDCYAFSVNLFEESRAAKLNPRAVGKRTSAHDAIEVAWRVRDQVWRHFKKSLGSSVVFSQTFIPAGRAFFTSIGRLVAGIEHAGSLDPATLKFARLFASWRDQAELYRPRFANSDEHQSKRRKVMSQLFGGIVQSKRDSEFIEMNDGRRVPFSSLSSGQQELLPIWYFLDNLMLMDSYYDNRPGKKVADSEQDGELIYIEEPEAHLFPAAQSMLLDTLVDSVLGGSKRRSLVITTHSPYIMTKLNVLLKAGQIGKRKRRAKELAEIVPRSTWLQRDDVAAFSIKDGQLCSIFDEDSGLIDAAFMDSISEVTSDQFVSLLDMED